MQFQPLIRYPGGKRKQSEEIIDQFPCKINTLWIPFLGGGSIMYQVLNSNIKFNKMVCTDIYEPLIDLWKIIRDCPMMLMNSYREHYAEWESGGTDYFYHIQDSFNKDPNPLSYYFLTRCATRGNILYDKNGNMVSKMSPKDSPALPSIIEPILYKWSEAIQDVEFGCETYNVPHRIEPNDYMFLDPPYIDGTWYKDNNLDMDIFYNYLRDLPCDYSITLNGDKDIYPIPEDLYTKHMYVYYGITTTSTGSKSGIRDSLWIKAVNGDYSNQTRNSRANGRPGGGKSSNIVDETKSIFILNDRVEKMEKDISNITQMMETILKEVKKNVR